jgi:hypothetical protein
LHKTSRLICFFLAVSVICAAADEPIPLFQQAQKILEEEPAHRNIGKAISLLKRATAEWQTASSKAPEYVAALDYLAVALMVQLREDAAAQDEDKLADFGEWIKRAGPYTKRALEICESNPAIEPEVRALALELEAQVEGQQGAGATLWARAAKIRAERVAGLNTKNVALGPVVEATEENVTAPLATSVIRPEYTRIALLAQYAGQVSLKAVVGIDGKAHNVELVQGLGFGLDEQAAKALLQSRFRQGKKNGRPISMAVNVGVTFRLN